MYFTGDLQGFEMVLAFVGLLLLFRILGRFGKIWKGEKTTINTVEKRTLRYVPDSIDRLVSITKFSKEELKEMYRNFKNECPHGVINEELFQRIYGHFFPNKGSHRYAQFVFRAFDHQDEGFINFEEFAVGLSKLLRGTLSDKLLWTFKLYDINQDGFISRNEVYEVVKSVYMLLGSNAEDELCEEMIQQHTDRVFDKFDRGHDDVITMDNFFEICTNNEEIVQFMTAFNSAI